MSLNRHKQRNLKTKPDYLISTVSVLDVEAEQSTRLEGQSQIQLSPASAEKLHGQEIIVTQNESRENCYIYIYILKHTADFTKINS